MILQLSCRDKNRLALQSDLLGAYALGIHNVLCVTGDHVTLGDHEEAKPVFDLDSVQLLQAVKLLEEGKDLGGSELEGRPQFCAGATVVPGAIPLEPQLLKFEKKINAGAIFFHTQAMYDLEKLKIFMTYARQFKVKVLAGVILLDSSAMIEEVSNRIPGISVPQQLREKMASVGDEKAQARGIEIAGRMVKQVKEESICDGVHLIAPGREEVVPDILAAAGVQ